MQVCSAKNRCMQRSLNIKITKNGSDSSVDRIRSFRARSLDNRNKTHYTKRSHTGGAEKIDYHTETVNTTADTSESEPFEPWKTNFVFCDSGLI